MNKMFGRLKDFAALARLSRFLTNPREEDRRLFKPELVYMHTNSGGYRKPTLKNGLKSFHLVDDGNMGEWRGYGEQWSQSFVWGSTHSTAIIKAWDVGREWRMSFTGCDTAVRQESYYALLFALTVDPATVEVEAGDAQALAKAVRPTSFYRQDNPEDARLLDLFCEVVGIPPLIEEVALPIE